MKSPRLTFSQRNGLAELPSQLDSKNIPKILRAKIFAELHRRIQGSSSSDIPGWPWQTIIMDINVSVFGEMAHNVSRWKSDNYKVLSRFIENADYGRLFDLLEAVLSHVLCPDDLVVELNEIFEREHSAWRVVDGNVITLVGTPEEAAALERALNILSSAGLFGARQHLSNAASALGSGDFAGCIRESIHSVEAVARALEPEADELSKALARLEAKGAIHGALKKAFLALYGYSSDEKGVRHSLVFQKEANVEEADALFMFGACASFVTYVIGKARSLGLKLQSGAEL